MERLTGKTGEVCFAKGFDWDKLLCQKNIDIFKNIVDRLAAYEDAEEQGLLVRLPCKVGSHVWRVWITDGRKPEITEHYMSDLLHIVQWVGKFGKTVFLTRDEAEAALAKE